MRATFSHSSSPARSARNHAAQARTSESTPLDTPTPKPRASALRARIALLAERLRACGRILERFLTDYYRACEVAAQPRAETLHTRSLHLRRGELHTLAEPGHFSQLEVLDGEIWLTQDPTSGDLLLGPGATFELRRDAPVVIEALEETSVEIRTVS